MRRSRVTKTLLTRRDLLLAMLVVASVWPLLLSAWVVRSTTDGESVVQAVREGWLPLLALTCIAEVVLLIMGRGAIKRGRSPQ